MKTLEFGLDTFLPVTVDAAGLPIRGDQVIRNTVQEAIVAETVGIDSFNIGEHYRKEFMDSASHVVLAAIASRTERIRLGTAVTVLSTQDPVRLYTDFATVGPLSSRAFLGSVKMKLDCEGYVNHPRRCARSAMQRSRVAFIRAMMPS